MRWVGIIGRSVGGVIVVYDLVRYFQTSRVFYLVLGGAIGVSVVCRLPFAAQAYRNAVFVAERLRRAAAEAQQPEVVQ